MDHNKEEYHDPDYPEASTSIKEEPPSVSEEEKVDTIRNIIRREFSTELEVRENEIMLIDQRMTTSRRLLHHLRYALVNNYYNDQKLQLTSSQIQDDIAAHTEPRARAEVSSLLRDSQKRLHPSVRKLLGRKAVDIDEIFRSRAPRNKARKDYSAMLQKRNYTISADSTRSLRPGPEPAAEPCRLPRHIQPRAHNVLTLDEVTRNKMKHRYRFIIGNTSKYAPAASRVDRSTHKWLLYVRGPRASAPPGPALAAVTARLHHSYAPHHTVHLHKPPYHISRRGWGEFPAKVELHFALPEMNRPATVEHTIKLDRHYTGLQMLGAETIVDVWLYSTPEMLEYEYKEEDDPPPNVQTEAQMDRTEATEIKVEPAEIKTEPEDIPFPLKEEPQDLLTTNFENCDNQDNWLDFFSKPTELDVDEMIIKPEKRVDDKKDLEPLIDTNVIGKCQETQENSPEVQKTDSDLPNELLNQAVKKRIVKYIDPTTGKIYYLEMDRALDLTKVQEIIINNTKAKISPIKPNGVKTVRKKKGVSLLKPEIKSLLKSESSKSKHDFSHIENDHCYLATPPRVNSHVLPVENKCQVKKESTLYQKLCSVTCRFTCVRSAVNYIIKRIPLVSDQVRDPDFVKNFPFVVENEEKYWKLDFAKRRNIEWSRAKLINRILTENFTQTETIWRTKQILLYSRLHGYYPIRSDAINRQTDCDWATWNMENIDEEANTQQLHPNANEICTLSVFDISQFDNLTECVDLTEDEDIDIVSDRTVVVKKEVTHEVEGLTVLPVASEQDRMMYLYVERKCADIGVELKNENVGNGYSYSAVHAVMLSAMRSFAEELIRNALAVKLTQDQSTERLPTVWAGSSSRPTALLARHVAQGGGAARLTARAGLAAPRPHAAPL